MTFLFAAASISSGDLLHGIFWLFIAGVVLGIIWMLIQKAPFMNAMFKEILGYIVILVGALITINFLLGLAGHPLLTW